MSIASQTSYGQRHAKRDLRTYAKSVDPDQPPRLRRRVSSGSALFYARHINGTYFSCYVTFLSRLCVFNIVYGLIRVYTICNVRRSLFAWRWPFIHCTYNSLVRWGESGFNVPVRLCIPKSAAGDCLVGCPYEKAKLVHNFRLYL